MWRSLLLACLLWHSPVWAKGAYEHALLIGVSRYADPAITELTGVPHDIESARQIAGAMGIPAANISVLRDAQATKANIVAALRRIGAAGSEGGRVLLYFSGHGTRWADPAAKGCVEGLLTYDREVIVNREWAELTRDMGQRADQLIVMFDACHSQGVTAGTRSLGGGMRPKFFMKAQEAGDLCSQPVNLRTRSLVQASHALGTLSENVVHITSSRPDEVSFDEPGKGGLATQGVRDCLLGKAKDLDGSGAVSLAEVEHCAQQVVRDKLKPHAELIPPHVSVAGFRNLVPVPVTPAPVVVAQVAPNRPNAAPAPAPAANTGPSAEQVRAEKERLARERREREAREAAERAEAQRQRQALEQAALQAQADERQRQREAERLRVERELAAAAEAGAAALQAAMAAQAAAEATPTNAQPAAAPTPTPSPPPPEVSARATLRDLEQQRDRRQKVGVKLDKPRLRIGQDFLNLHITAPHDGHVYLVMMGSDERSFYVLFPNGLDSNNRVRAGQTLRLPGPTWQLQAAGPAGTNELLVMVTRQPRSLDGLQGDGASAGSPFVTAAADAEGRQRLQRALLGQGSAGATRFSAQRITVEEVQ